MDEGSVSTGDGLTRSVGFFGLLLTSEGSIIGSGWLFGALACATIGGPAAIIAWVIGSFAVMGAITIAFSSILVRLSHASASDAAIFRCVYALPVLGLLVLREDRLHGRRSWRERRAGLLSGVFFAIDLMLWNRSIADVGAGLATVLANIQVVLVPLVAWALLLLTGLKMFWPSKRVMRPDRNPLVLMARRVLQPAASASRARSAKRRKVSASRTAMSARILRSSSTPASCRPCMNCEYDMPCWRAAALMRVIHRRRKSRLRFFRSR